MAPHSVSNSNDGICRGILHKAPGTSGFCLEVMRHPLEAVTMTRGYMLRRFKTRPPRPGAAIEGLKAKAPNRCNESPAKRPLAPRVASG
jgi:hypothetical protein